MLFEQLLIHWQNDLRYIDRLKGQVMDLELALGLDKAASVQAAFGVSESLAQTLILLADGKAKSKEQLHAGLYYRKPDVDAPEVKTLDKTLSLLRKQMHRHGVEITTIWSGGYMLTAGIDKVRAAIEQDRAEEARLRKLERERERQRRIRAAQGRQDRKTYEQQSLSRQRPWDAEGISRRTWYERRRTREIATNDNAVVQRANQQVAA